MSAPAASKPLVAVVGPTASGKSVLGIRLAQEFGGEVVVCDSTQVYRGFDIGTAKVTPEEQQGIAHHLMDLCAPHEVFTAGEYRARALEVLRDLDARSKLPVFTVGTGLYLRALLEGLSDAPPRSEELRERLRESTERRGPEWLHRILQRLDREAAGRIAPRDAPKLIRAIEVSLVSGRPITELHRAGRPRLEGWTPIKIGLMPPREELYKRIEQRVDKMLDAGWVEEVRARLKEGLSPAAKPFQFIGYGELRQHVMGELSLTDAVHAIRQATRRYAKRQITWFRKEPGVHWLHGFGNDSQIQTAAAGYLKQQLAAMRAFRSARQEAV